MFYISFAKSVISYPSIFYWTAAKTSLMKVENTQRRLLRAIFSRRKFISSNNIWYEHKIQTVFETYISEQCFTPYTCKGSHLPTRGAQETIFPRNIIGQSSSVNVSKTFRKFHNYLLSLNLIPQILLKMTKSEMKSYVDSVRLLLYVRDNREVLSLFF